MEEKEIIKLAKKIEKENKIKILFLIESGSRAWKWGSDDSDYDIRGIFIQDYLIIENLKEQIDKESGKLDISLWDFRKFLRLMANSNPTCWEWLSSDIVYLENNLRKKLKIIYKKDFNPMKLKKHYLSMARDNFKKYIDNKKTKANLKKYIYVLRSISCVLWIEKYKTPTQKNYKKVIILLPKDIQKFFEQIVKEKKKSEEVLGNRNKKIDMFIIRSLKKIFKKEKESFDLNGLNKIFKQALKNERID